MATNKTPKGRKPAARAPKSSKSGRYVTSKSVAKRYPQTTAMEISVNRKSTKDGRKAARPVPSIVAMTPTTDAEAQAQINELIKENKSVLHVLAKL